MLQCKECECKYPPSYKNCPVCRSTNRERERFVIQDEDTMVVDSALVICDDTISLD